MRAGAGRLALLAWAGAALIIILAMTAVGLAAATGTMSLKRLVLSVVWTLPAALIAAGRPRIAVGWLLLAVAGLFSSSALADQWVLFAGQHGTGVVWAVWWSDRFSAVLAVLTGLALLLLPDGRLPARGWRIPIILLVAAQLVAVAAWCLVSGPVAAPDSTWPPWVAALGNPLGVLPTGVGEGLSGADLVLLQLPLLVCVASLPLRIRRSSPSERSRVTGLVLAGVILVLVVVLGHLFWPGAADLLDVSASVFFAVVLTSAVLRRRLDRVDVVIHHATVVTILTMIIAAAYVAVNGLVGLAGQDLPPFGAGVLAGVVALATLPLRGRLQGAVDRWLYGDRRNPYAAIQRLEKVHLASGPEQVLTELAAVVAAALRVPWARAEAGGLHGERGVLPFDGSPVSVPLMAGSDPIGLLHAAARPGRTLNSDDQALLAALGRHGGLAVRTAMLAEGLRDGREKLLAVRADEQSRLRRDLHDDLGPTLAALSMQLDALGPLLAREPRLAAMELERLHRVALEAMEQVRRLSRGLRPPALDQLGLVEGLRQLGAELGLDLTIEDDDVMGLPAAVEVAAYYIAREALSNVARHSGSRTAMLRLEADDNAVTVIVADHGFGVVSSRPNGVGRSAMRERAEELGGRLVITSVPGAGTTVVAVLPLTTMPIGTLT